MYGWAQYRLGLVYVKTGDDQRALAHLAKAIAWARSNKDEAGLGPAARRELVTAYSRTGDPALARALFSQRASGPELEKMLSDLERCRRGGP